jgi:PKD domain/Abnormal spindle-like microcephaly-assoc'd, ASPM-SPD-2-Hydin
MRPASLAAVCAVLLALGSAHARRHRSGDSTLMQVLTPAGRAAAPAHPDVNVIVRFAGPPGNTLGDPASFRAHLASHDVTDRFKPILEQGKQVGVRAKIPHDRLRIGRRRNRLRLSIRSRRPGTKGRPDRQIVRLHFRAVDADDRPPQAIIVPESEVIFPNLPTGFDASRSFDPESDELTYQWDFGDGSTSSDIAPEHTYASADEPRTVTLTVSDGQKTSSATLTMRSCPQPDGAAPGLIQVAADGPLEFGGVAVGASATRTFQVTNTAIEPTSRLAACVGFDGVGFSVSPEQVELGPGESATVTVTFAPEAAGHASASIALASGDTTRPLVSLLAHGYGGNAPGPGPTLASVPLFYVIGDIAGDMVKGFLPSGAPIAPDLGVHSCGTDPNFSFGDACVDNADCATNGGTCQPSTGSGLGIDELCGDGVGGLFMLSEDGFTDNTDADPALTGTLVGVTLDANGNTTGSTILSRLTEDTTHLACDTFAAGDDGRVYVAETEGVPAVDTCLRDTKESLIGFRKNNGSPLTVMDRIDSAEGLSDCDDVDQTTHIEVSGDGSQAFASFDSGGLWRIRPSPLEFLDTSYFEDYFRLAPDGSIVFATVKSAPTTATVNLYRVTPSQVTSSPLPGPGAGLTPCASFQLPNRKDAPIGLIVGIAVAPPTPGSRDGTVLVNVAGSRSIAVSDTLTLRATVAFSAPADSTACAPIEVINLERMDALAF